MVEDDIIETMKFNRTVSSLNVDCSINEAKNGEEAINFLMESDQLPDIIILDLNMPKINGIEFLKIMKSYDKLKGIPTIILTTSTSQKDLLECNKIGVSGYMVKPLKYENYVTKITKTLSYWSESERFIS